MTDIQTLLNALSRAHSASRPLHVMAAHEVEGMPVAFFP